MNYRNQIKHEENNPLRVTSVQMSVNGAATSCSFENILSVLRQASAAKSRLVVFPEATLGGYMHDSKEQALENALAEDDARLQALSESSVSMKIDIVIGVLVKTKNGELHNNAIHFACNGSRYSYTKSTPIWLGVDRFCKVGDQLFGKINIDGFVLGLLICYDLTYPVNAIAAAWAGCDGLLLSTNWPLTSLESTANFTVRSRANENKLYIIAANKIGHEAEGWFCGASCIVDTLGNFIKRATSISKSFQWGKSNKFELLTADIYKAPKQRIYSSDYCTSIFDARCDLYSELNLDIPESETTSHSLATYIKKEHP